MSAQVIQAAQTDQYCEVKVWQTSDGTAKTDLTYSTSGLVIKYQIGNAAVQSVSVGGSPAPASMSAGGSHADWGFYHIDAGRYKIGLADAVVASAGRVSVWVTVTDCESTVCDIDVVGYDKTSVAVGANTTAPPTAAAIRSEIDSNSTQLAAIVEDTGTTLPSTLSGIETKVDTVDGVVDDILVDTGTTLPSTLTSISSAITVVDGIVDDILVDTGATLPATLSGMETKIDTVDTVVDTLTTSLSGVETKIDTIDGIVDDILVDTGTTLPATLSGIETKVDTIDGIVDDILVDTGTTLPATLSTIDTEVGQILDRTGYSLTILAGAISNAGNAAEQYDLTIDTVDHRVLYDSLDSSGNRGTTTLSKP